jgi:hypothetical protein
VNKKGKQEVIKAAIDRIAQLVEAGSCKTLLHEGNQYVVEQGKLRPLIKDPPEVVGIGSLKGIQDFIEADAAIQADMLGVHIVSYCCVTVLGKLQPGNHNDRWTYLKSVAAPTPFPFGKYLPVNEFIINLQACFVQSDETAKILKIVGTIRDETIKTLNDDGVTQVVNVKSGIDRTAEANLPNPVRLQPYRTFPEIYQPSSPFVFRMQSGSGLPTCGLFEADGGFWKIQAIDSIYAYLKGILPETVTILR